MCCSKGGGSAVHSPRDAASGEAPSPLDGIRAAFVGTNMTLVPVLR
jgi:hypothetical protein